MVGGRHQMRKMSGKPVEVRLVLAGHSEGQLLQAFRNIFEDNFFVSTWVYISNQPGDWCSELGFRLKKKNGKKSNNFPSSLLSFIL